jgi:hypothetical protein
MRDLGYIFGPNRDYKWRNGLKYCRYAGYGFRWFRGRRVADPGEQAVMAQIVAWKEAGWSFRRIAVELMVRRVKTPGGTEWSTDRVRRAYRAARSAPISNTGKNP